VRATAPFTLPLVCAPSSDAWHCGHACLLARQQQLPAAIHRLPRSDLIRCMQLHRPCSYCLAVCALHEGCVLPVRPSLQRCMPICQPPPQAGLEQADPTLSGPHMITELDLFSQLRETREFIRVRVETPSRMYTEAALGL
jgi:hypothetical protein